MKSGTHVTRKKKKLHSTVLLGVSCLSCKAVYGYCSAEFSNHQRPDGGAFIHPVTALTLGAVAFKKSQLQILYVLCMHCIILAAIQPVRFVVVVLKLHLAVCPSRH